MSRADTTALLARWQEGDRAAESALIERVYPELRRVAATQLRARSSRKPLQVTELVHETYLRLADQRRVDWRGRAHFFAIAARLMRRVLHDHWRTLEADKRGGGVAMVAFDEELAAGEPQVAISTFSLHRALERLAEVDEAASRVAELRFFGGLTLEEVAEVSKVGRSTVVRTWRFARAWLKDELAPGDST